MVQHEDSCIKVNGSLLLMQSEYFKSFFLGKFAEKWVNIPIDCSSIILDIVLNYLHVGAIVVPHDLSAESWVEVAEVAEYFCLTDLLKIVEAYLCKKAS